MDPLAVEWAAIPGPRWYQPETVTAAFADLAKAIHSDTDQGAGVRSAVGNDHAGTLYPAAVTGTDVLLGIISDRTGPPRDIALSILLDWWGCFQPEPGFESYMDPAGQTVDLIPAIVQRVEQAAETLQAIAEQDTNARGAVRELVRLMNQGWTVAVQPSRPDDQAGGA
ncbi:hypothetical protein [Streptosporangium sp. KLBMP 9127]|nr:hypothetical protein [Streptosporangium sp. KLBMP 9127]